MADDLTSALTSPFGRAPLAIMPLITFRDELRARLQHAKRGLGRIAPDTDIDSLTLALVGGGHLLLTDRDATVSESATTSLDHLVTAVIAAAIA